MGGAWCRDWQAGLSRAWRSHQFSPYPKLCFQAALRGELNETEPGIWSGPFEKPSTFSSELTADIQTAFVLGLRLFLM